MRTDLKVGVICLFALVLACVGFFAYHSNKGGTDVAVAPSHPAANHALSVSSPADAPTAAPSLAPAPTPSLASAFGPSHALGADTFSGTISPPSPTTAPSNTSLVPPAGSTGLSSPGGMSAPSSLNQPLVPSSGSTGLIPPGGTGMSTGTPSLLPPSTGPSSVSGGFGSPSGTSGTSGFGTGSTGTTGRTSHPSTLEIGPSSHTSTSGSSVDVPGFGTSASSGISSGSSGGEYAIQKGDTLAALAKKNHTTTKAILAANPGVNPNRLKVGQKVKIPEASSSTGTSSSSALGGSSLPGSGSSSFDTTFGTGSTTTKPASKGHKGATGASTRSASKGKTSGSQSALAGGTYTIKKGDTLRKIAKSVYGDERLWRRIFRANRGDLASPNALKVGETIHLPK